MQLKHSVWNRSRITGSAKTTGGNVAKNIVVFSDGTGQDGAVRLDARLSNIYKLYRASRIGADSSIDPAKQIAFYDPGLGTDADSHGWGKLPRAIYKMWASIAGRGIGTNIADCYEFIINHWQPGDRIFIFGFSRGAYTARCVAQVLSLCGVPTHASNDPKVAFLRFGRQSRLVAERAVHEVYEHGAGYDRGRYEAERDELARRFRAEFGSDDKGVANVNPHFIGVFDTVAALGAKGFKRYALIGALAMLGAVAVAAVAGIVSWLQPWMLWRLLSVVAVVAVLLAVGRVGTAVIAGLVLALAATAAAAFGMAMSLPALTFWQAFAVTGVLAGAASLIKLRRGSYRYIDDFPTGRKGHHIRWKAANYDRGLSGHVGYARQAAAIDETRADFPRVEWGKDDVVRKRIGEEPDPFIQLYFPGNHSDVGGSYPEPESRLSDIALSWMLQEATSIPHPLIVDPSRLQPFPDPTGIQHSEPEAVRQNTLWWVPPWAPAWLRRGWSEKYRTVNGYAMHPSVFQRFAAKSVDVNGVRTRYCPHNLRNDRRFAWAFKKTDPWRDELVGAQSKASYSANGVDFTVGDASKALVGMLKNNNAISAVGIFPGNPKPDADSEYCDGLALSMLTADLERIGLAAVPLERTATLGAHVEQGLLCLDITDTDAMRLARSFGAMTMLRVDPAGDTLLVDITPSLE